MDKKSHPKRGEPTPSIQVQLVVSTPSIMQLTEENA